MNTIKLGGKTVYDPPDGKPDFINHFTWYSGASRPGQGYFLMKRSDYESIATSTPASLAMTSDQGPGITLNVVVAGAATAFPAIERADDLVKVVVFDVRAKLVRPMIRAYNVARLGVHPPAFYRSTTFGADGTTQFTWEQLLTDLEVNVDNATLPTAWKPRNTFWDNVPKARIVDDVAGRLYLIAGFDGTNVKLYDPGTASDENDLPDVAMHAIEGSGGLTARNLKARIPGVMQVTFTGNAPGADDPYKVSSRFYTKDVTNSVGDSNLTQSLHVGEYQGLYENDAWTNQAELDAVATDIAARHIAAMSADISDATYAGIWPFKLDGEIRAVRWISNAQGARTIVRKNNDRDFSEIAQLGRANETIQNLLVAGLGDTRTSLSPGGTRFVTAAGDSSVVVKLTGNRSDGGEYNGRIGYGAMTSTNGNLNMPEAYSFPNADNAIVYNPPETGTSSHSIPFAIESKRYRLGKVTGVVASGDDKGKRIVVLDGGSGLDVAWTTAVGDGSDQMMQGVTLWRFVNKHTVDGTPIDDFGFQNLGGGELAMELRGLQVEGFGWNTTLFDFIRKLKFKNYEFMPTTYGATIPTALTVAYPVNITLTSDSAKTVKVTADALGWPALRTQRDGADGIHTPVLALEFRTDFPPEMGDPPECATRYKVAWDRIFASDTGTDRIYAHVVIPGPVIPCPPSSGTYILRSVDGVLGWVEAGVC